MEFSEINCMNSSTKRYYQDCEEDYERNRRIVQYKRSKTNECETDLTGQSLKIVETGSELELEKRFSRNLLVELNEQNR